MADVRIMSLASSIAWSVLIMLCNSVFFAKGEILKWTEKKKKNYQKLYMVKKKNVRNRRMDIF